MSLEPMPKNTTCLCPSCTADFAPTYIEEFRLYTEAKLLLTWTLADRRAYLAKLKRDRRSNLEAELMRQHLERKAGW